MTPAKRPGAGMHSFHPFRSFPRGLLPGCLLIAGAASLLAWEPVTVQPERCDYVVKVPFAEGGTNTQRRRGLQYVFRCGDQEMFAYQANPGPFPRPSIPEVYRRGGYLTDLHTPSGRRVSGDYPPDHLHHHGIWMAWTKTLYDGRDPDFWNMGQAKGRVECQGSGGGVGLHAIEVFGAHRFIDMSRTPETVVLNETWRITAGVREWPRRVYVINLVSTQTCATNEPLVLPKYHYGGLGVRGNESWNGEARCLFLTSSGETNRVAANETRGRWCWMGGEVDGQIAGLAVLCHPSNDRFPQPLRVHPREPFLCFAPPQLGEMRIEPGRPYVARYRIILADGKPSVREAEQWWADYAAAAESSPGKL